jgi:amino acid transporter
MQQEPTSAHLKRSIGLPGMVFFGVGTMIGGGFYALLGKMVGLTGAFTPLSLLLAGAIALMSAFSFAELSRRYPTSAGEVQYVDAAFGRSWLSRLVGLLVILTGVVSAATLCAATGGFLLDITGAPAGGLITLTAVLLTLVASWGVAESVIAVAAITLLEAGTLLAIILLSPDRLLELPDLVSEMALSIDSLDGAALVSSAFLAFYAFVGFEDMVNMAEETRDVERTMPRAIFISMFITVTLYLGVATVAMGLEDRAALASANTPLALLLPQGQLGALGIGIISILAGLNGALVQLVMASRVLYGMANKGMAPAFLRRVNTRTSTPLNATVLAGFAILVLATSFTLTGLAQATSFIILAVFTLVNLALASLLWSSRKHTNIRAVPWLPLLAALSCAAMLLVRLALELKELQSP